MLQEAKPRSARAPRAGGAFLCVLLVTSILGLGGATVPVDRSAPWAAAPIAEERVGAPPSGAPQVAPAMVDLRLIPSARTGPAGAATPPGAGQGREAEPGQRTKPRVVDATGMPSPRDRGAEPTRLTVPEVDIDLTVVSTGIADDGTMALPDTVTRAGWYRHSSRPREPRGTTVIAAHVDTRAEGLGAFAALADVRRGAEVTVTDRRGRDTRYRVTTRRLVPRTSLPVQRLFDRDGPARLVLITCGGAYDAEAGYTDNVVVIAQRQR